MLVFAARGLAPFDSCSHHSIRPCLPVNHREPWVISQLLFNRCWSEEPLDLRRHSQTGPGQNLMRNREALEPEVEVGMGAEGGRDGGRETGGGCAELCGW